MIDSRRDAGWIGLTQFAQIPLNRWRDPPKVTSHNSC
jgi:hypothetical protein